MIGGLTSGKARGTARGGRLGGRALGVGRDVWTSRAAEMLARINRLTREAARDPRRDREAGAAQRGPLPLLVTTHRSGEPIGLHGVDGDQLVTLQALPLLRLCRHGPAPSRPFGGRDAPRDRSSSRSSSSHSPTPDPDAAASPIRARPQPCAATPTRPVIWILRLGVSRRGAPPRGRARARLRAGSPSRAAGR